MPDDQPTITSEYVVEQLFPRQQVSLISGPSGAGKTTLALQILDEWAASATVLDHPARAVPLCFVACDRTDRALRAHMRRMDINPAHVPHCSLVKYHRREERSIETAVKAAIACCPVARVLFIDGMSTLCPGKVTDLRDVADFLLTTLRLCESHDVTIIGTVLSVKTREGEGYVSARDRIIGSGAWAALTDTKLFIEPTQPKKPEDPGRSVTIVTAYGTSTRFYAFDNCRLVGRGAEIIQPDLDHWLLSLSPGAPLSLEDILAAAASFSIGRTKTWDWITAQVELGALVRIGRGKYETPGGAGRIAVQ